MLGSSDMTKNQKRHQSHPPFFRVRVLGSTTQQVGAGAASWPAVGRGPCAVELFCYFYFLFLEKVEEKAVIFDSISSSLRFLFAKKCDSRGQYQVTSFHFSYKQPSILQYYLVSGVFGL